MGNAGQSSFSQRRYPTRRPAPVLYVVSNELHKVGRTKQFSSCHHPQGGLVVLEPSLVDPCRPGTTKVMGSL